MNPGEFRHPTNILIKGEAQQSDYGDFKQNTTFGIERFAKVKWLPGSEVLSNDTITLERNIEFTYRAENFTEALDRTDTITYKNIVFYISSIRYIGQNNEQYIVVKAHSNTD